MRRTLLILVGLTVVCGVLLFGRHYLDAHPVILGIVATVIAVVGWTFW